MATYITEPQMSTITRLLLKGRTGEFDLEVVHTLSLRDMGITDLGCISECEALAWLDLSHNDVSRLYGLAGLMNLVDLNLSCNRISNLEGLQSLDNLEKLNLAGNLIGSVDALRTLSCLEKFYSLRLSDLVRKVTNPACQSLTYRRDALAVLPGLRVLDGEQLQGRPSDFYRKCNVIASKLTELAARPEPEVTTGDWPGEDFFTHQKEKEFDESIRGDMDKQFTCLLEDCKKLSLQTKVKMDNLKKELNEQHTLNLTTCTGASVTDSSIKSDVT